MELKILRQILLMSKHAIFGLIIQCMLYSIILANNGVAQKASIEEIYVSFELKDVPVEDAFKVLEQRTDFKFNYDKIVLKEQQRITAFAKKESLANVLRDISKTTGLQFTRIDENIHVSKKKNATASVTEVISEEDVVQTSISGTVTSVEDGLPLPGVSILIKGSSTGAVTDFEGNYRITVNQGSILQFSYIGFKSKEIEVNNQSVINVSLDPDLEQLEEVVVIGYGTQKKADITGAIATLEPENVTERPLNKVDQVLVGQLAGVRVKQTSGLPGKGFSIQVRGTGSINANNEPLYVVDGFPLEASSQSSSGGFSNGNPLNNLNPNDIESIQVLKDAASASIYGSRGSNGVVLITTKKGKTGKPQISFNTYTGWSETVKKLDVLSADEWVDRQIEHINYAWVKDHASDLGATSSQTNEERRALLGLPEGSVNTNYMFDDRWFDENHEGLDYLDYQDLFFRKGFMQNYQLSATGGTEIAKYYISGDMFDQEGVALGVDYTRYSARANVELTPNKKLRFGLNLSPSYSIANDPGVEGKDAITHIVVGTSPVVESYAGPYGNNVGENAPYAWGTSRPSPLAEAREKIGTGKTFRTISTIFGEYEILSGLKFKASVNYDVHNYNHKSWTPSYVNRNRTASAGYSGYTRQNFVQENTLNYSKTFGNHNLSVLGGYSYSLYKFEAFSLSGTGFASDEVTTINAATSVSGSSSESKNVLISYFGRAQYSFMDKYLFSASIRRDGSSKFGDNTKWGIFPSASVGWRISEEAFMQGIEPISDFKIRASWGIAGNNGIGDYGHVATLANSNYSFGGSLVNGQAPDPENFPNPDLSWEESETIDIGFDLGLLDNRIFTSFDYYTKRNSKLLLEIPVPTASGFQDALTNIGEILNKGWEVEVSTRNLVGDFKWNTKVNFSHNTNEVKKLGPNNTPILGGAFDIYHNILEVGRPMYTLYLVQEIGILTSEDIANGYPVYGNEEAGDPKYLDANGDGVIDADDRTYSGHPNPDYVWGITNNFSYKGFDLSILMQGQWGGVIYSTFGRAMNRTGQGKADNHLGYIRDRVRWEEDGVITAEDIEGKVRKSPSSFGRIKNTDWRYPNDYWRVRNITLGYDLGSLFQSNVISGARVYVTAENWFGKDKYYGGFNPEAVNNSGDDYGAFPLSKSMIFGVNLKF